MNQRSHAVAKLHRYLLRRGLPRFQMTMIVVGTGLAGFGVSVALLALGTSSMPVRYVLAVAAAYAVFLLLVRLWVEYQRRRLEADADASDVVSDFIPDAGGMGGSEEWLGGGGRFGGGGAGRSWESSAPHPVSSVTHSSDPTFEIPAVDSGPSSWSGSRAGLALDVDLDEGWVLVVPVVVLLGGLLAAAYVIYAAPVLLAEVFLDVALVSGLYRTLRKLEPQSWLTTAIRRTWAPVTAVALLVAAGGYVMQAMVPQADSIGDVPRSIGRCFAV